ncbi:chlorophyll a/b-binding protein [Vasconcelosia minhoensis]|nr:chlorophyll a/b-binding protein [Romeria gracilis]
MSDSAERPRPAFGWTRYTERLNGRFAMVGFVALLVIEAVTGQSFWSWVGLL